MVEAIHEAWGRGSLALTQSSGGGNPTWHLEVIAFPYTLEYLCIGELF